MDAADSSTGQQARDVTIRPESSWLCGASDSFGLRFESAAELPAGTDLGGVTIVRPIGAGGMGRIYEARQHAPARAVAVKLMRNGIVSKPLLRRFEFEAEVLARLRHPNIAQIFMVGSHRQGDLAMPFIVMELVPEARTLTRFAEENRLSVRERVRLFASVCEAIAHGHRNGVIHRDLKPGNILVDASGVVKVIDFGVARSTDAGETRSLCTNAGELVGTLLYMSPEQMGAASGMVDTRTDVYALGVVLFELVTGKLPCDLRGKSLPEAARLLAAGNHRLAESVELASAGDDSIGRFEARGLGTLVASCLQPLPEDRYPTAVEVAAEIGRWLSGEPILARPPSLPEALWRLCRRHRAAALAAAAVALSLVIATATVTAFSLRAERQRQEAETARGVAEERRQEADRLAASLRAELYLSDVLLAAEARDRDNLPEARRLLAEARGLASSPGGGHAIELDCLAASLDDSLAVFDGQRSTVTAVAWNQAGTRLAMAGSDGSIRIGAVPDWPGDGAPATSIALDSAATIWSLAWSPDGSAIAAALADGTARVHDVGTGVERLRIDHGGGGKPERLYGVAYSSDGRILATASKDKTARLWDASSGREMLVLRGHAGTVHAVAFSQDGRTLATASQDSTVRLWNRADGRELSRLEGHADRVFGLAFAADDSRLASGSEDGSLRIWDLVTGRETACLRHPFRVNALAFIGPDQIASGSGDGILRIWQISEQREVGRRRGHGGAIFSIAATTDGRWIASGSADTTTRIWRSDLQSDPAITCLGGVSCVAASSDGSLIATAGDGQSGQDRPDDRHLVQLWDPRTLEPVAALAGSTAGFKDICFTPDGERLAAATEDGSVCIWRLASHERTLLLKPHDRRIYSLDVVGDRLATAAEDRKARLTEISTGAALGPDCRHPRRVLCARLSADGSRLYTACEDRLARCWNPVTAELLATFAGHTGPVNWLALSPDGRRLATASSDETVRIWDADTASPLATLTGPSRQIWKVAFSPDGSRVAAVSADATVQIWDAATGRKASMLRGHTDQVWGLAFGADGRTLVSGGWDGTARIWGLSAAGIGRSPALKPGRGRE